MAKPIKDVVTRQEAEETPWEEYQANTKAPGRIVVPTKEEKDAVLRRLSGTDPRLCGYCKYFDLEIGQKEFARDQNAFNMAVNELEHDPAWYMRVDMMGACHKFDGHSPHAMAPAKVPNQFMDSSIEYNQRDQPIDCPYWTPRRPGERSSRRRIVSSPVHRKG